MRNRPSPLALLVLTAAFLFATAPLRAQEQWLPRTSGTTAHLWGVAYGGGANELWVAVGEQGTILTSPNAATWTPRVSGFPARRFLGVAYGRGLWVAVGGTEALSDHLGVIVTSPDGITWTPRVTTGVRFNNVAFGNGTFVAVNDVGDLRSSLDGLTWKPGATGPGRYLRGLAYGAPIFVTTGLSGLRTTYDGSSPTDRLPSAGQLEGVAWGRDQFVAVGTAGLTYTSPDGLAWTQQPTTTTLSAHSATFFINQFIAVGTTGIATSFDGSAWTNRPAPLGPDVILLGVASGASSVVAVGRSGTILHSLATSVPLAIAAQPKPATEIIGGNVAFSVTVSGTSMFSYQWLRNGTPVPGATSSTLFLPNVQIAQAGSYSCAVTNGIDTVTTAAATLTIRSTLPTTEPVDPSFTLGPALSTAPLAAAVQTDGKILIGGSFTLLNSNPPQSGLARLHADGALDATFKPGSLDATGSIRTIAIQPDGKILIGGSFTSINGAARNRLARLLPDGSLDLNFPAASALSGDVHKIVLARDGRVLVSSAPRSLTAFSSSGVVDASFPASGSTSTTSSPDLPPFTYTYSDLELTATPSLLDFDLQADGKIVRCVYAGYISIPRGTRSPPGGFNHTSEGNLCFIVRNNADGSYDGTFPLVARNADFLSVRALPDGQVISVLQGDPFLGFTVFRFQNVGGNTAPSTVLHQSPRTTLKCAVVARDGRVWLGGGFTQISAVPRNQLARLNADGSIDSTFDPGRGLTDRDGARVEALSLLALDDGRALVTGNFTRIGNTARTQVALLNAQTITGNNSPALTPLAPSALYQEVRAGEPLHLSLTASGSPDIVYHLTTPTDLRTDFAGGQLSFVPDLPAAYGNIGVYSVTATNSAGVSSPQKFFVRIVPSAPFDTSNVSIPPRNQQAVIPLGANFTFPAPLVGGTPPFTYQWFRDESALPGATDRTYTISNATHANDGTYHVVVTNSLGSVTMPDFIILVAQLAFFIQQPMSRTVLTGENPTFTVKAGGDLPLSYQWSKNGVAINGATTATYTINAATLADAGVYTVAINGGLISQPATLTVQVPARLSNVAVRTTLSANQVLTVGFTMQGGAKSVLLRAVGPGLTALGVTGAMSDPRLTLFDATSTNVAANDNWSGATAVSTAMTQVGAFPLFGPLSFDAALVRSVSGSHTVQTSGPSAGTVLVEVYDATPGTNTPRLTNLSALNHVGTGGDVLIAGFTLAGAGTKTLLIRAAGPSLAPLGVPGVLADPKLELFDAQQTKLAENDTYAPALTATFTAVGAFALLPNARDAALLATLSPGSYTCVVSGVNNTTGTALVEVYEVP